MNSTALVQTWAFSIKSAFWWKKDFLRMWAVTGFEPSIPGMPGLARSSISYFKSVQSPCCHTFEFLVIMTQYFRYPVRRFVPSYVPFRYSRRYWPETSQNLPKKSRKWQAKEKSHEITIWQKLPFSKCLKPDDVYFSSPFHVLN